MKDATQIIVRPLLTEKSVGLQRFDKFTFVVARDATKIDIQFYSDAKDALLKAMAE